ncbi:PREDICTED: uncharacterized protein LOC107169164, partial [Diuraphis noxia]|uniref:uncharacterized protein LOC107169164 n=1 Tax=Diuraphis noxia TaxID=143948 RepID=UPI000763764A
MGNLILKNVLERVKQLKFYSVIFNETTDISKISQLVTVIRYVYKNEVYEDFVGFFIKKTIKNTVGEVEPKITGEIIGNSVLSILDKLDLPFEKCVGITTDGCSVMLSKKCGAVKTLAKMKNAIKYTCFSHALNMSIMKGCKIKFKVRFDEDLMSVYDLDVVLPNIIKIKSIFDDKCRLNNKIKNVINQFGDLVVCEINIPRDILESTLMGKFEVWHNNWLQDEQLPSSHLEALKRCDPYCFSGIYVLLKILITLPATGATAERNFSSLQRIKTWMRSRISEVRLNGLALLHDHRDVEINHDDVIDIFTQSANRIL